MEASRISATALRKVIILHQKTIGHFPPILSKILEKIVYVQPTCHSTTSPLLQMYVEEDKMVSVMTVDPTTTFDMVVSPPSSRKTTVV